ncbi:MAG: response regulator transcription factor [Thermodesulfobacteriota bacterium]
MTILVVDDDTELCELLTDYLVPEGFEVETVHNGETGAALALKGNYDLIVLDVMLPGLNGLDVLRKIRAGSSVPVLMLTARGDDVDRIVGLELGADDYLAKPFNPREMVARIRAIQRRTAHLSSGYDRAGNDEDSKEITSGDLKLNPATHSVLSGAHKVELTAVEFSILHQLLLKTGKVVSRDDLAGSVLGRKLEMFDRSIDVHISSIRKKLGYCPNSRAKIISIRGVGYQFLPEESPESL